MMSRPHSCAQCGSSDIPENEDFCSEECAWTYDEILLMTRLERHYEDE